MPREASAPWTTPASPSRAVRPTAGAARPATAARPPPRWPDRPLRQDGGRSENLLGLLPQEVQPIELGKEDEEAGIGDPETHPASSRARPDLGPDLLIPEVDRRDPDPVELPEEGHPAHARQARRLSRGQAAYLIELGAARNGNS